MDNSVNRVSQAYTKFQANNVGEKPENKADKKEDSKPQVEQQQPQVSAEETLKFMNAQAVSARPVEQPRVLNVSKYVTPEQAERICGFISQFEDAVAQGLQDIEIELGSALSDDAKLNLAIEMFEAQNM